MTEFQRRASAVWSGDLKGGAGKTSADSGAFEGLDVTFATRFTNKRNKGRTNPEEFIAAAHSSCFNMALSDGLSQAGNVPDKLETNATVTLTEIEGGFRVSRIHLDVVGTVPGIDEEAFVEAAKVARDNCPMSKLLTPGVDEVTLEARLS